MSWKVGWGEPLVAEEAIASLCHRRLDPLSLVHFQEVLTKRWQDKHPREFQDLQGHSFPRHTVRQSRQSSSPFASPSHSRGPTRQQLGGRSSLPKIDKPNMNQTMLPQGQGLLGDSLGDMPMKSRDAFGAYHPLSSSRPSSKFGATMRNSSSLPSFGQADPRHLGHATEVRSFLRSRQGSSKSSRGGHSYEPF